MEDNLVLNNEEENFDNKVVVTDEDNNQITIEVLNIFSLDQYPNKEYILCTLNETEGDLIKTYVSILNEKEDSFFLENIVDENEFNLVEQYVKQQDGE